MKKKRFGSIAAMILGAIFLVLLLVAMLHACQHSKKTPQQYTFIEDIKPEYVNNDRDPVGVPYISIPGFEYLTMVADQSSQNIQLYNPEDNPCYFVITLMLSDGTEIYRSDMLAPGNELTSIMLTRPLSEGIYEDVLLRYTCYSLEDLLLMNGATIKLNLEVIS